MGAFKGVYVLIRVFQPRVMAPEARKNNLKPQTQGGQYSLVQLGCNPNYFGSFVGQQVAEVPEPCSHHFEPNPASFQAP